VRSVQKIGRFYRNWFREIFILEMMVLVIISSLVFFLVNQTAGSLILIGGTLLLLLAHAIYGMVWHWRKNSQIKQASNNLPEG
jgi:F0F1-type ATP synthase assembly protein I